MKKLLFLILLFSCVPTKKLDSWIGRYDYELLESWGPANRSTSNGNGGQILVFTHAYYYRGDTYEKQRFMYVDSLGRIYMWKARTVKQVPMQMKLNW